MAISPDGDGYCPAYRIAGQGRQVTWDRQALDRDECRLRGGRPFRRHPCPGRIHDLRCSARPGRQASQREAADDGSVLVMPARLGATGGAHAGGERHHLGPDEPQCLPWRPAHYLPGTKTTFAGLMIRSSAPADRLSREQGRLTGSGERQLLVVSFASTNGPRRLGIATPDHLDVPALRQCQHHAGPALEDEIS